MDRSEFEPLEVTRLLQKWSGGDEHALEELMPLLYEELHRIASRFMRRERKEHTLQTTALVHEAYMQLLSSGQLEPESRTHFYAVAAHLMRRILVDHARGRKAQKRGGDFQRIPLEDSELSSSPRSADLVELDDALQSLQDFDETKGRILELRFFGGLTVEETSVVLGLKAHRVHQEGELAKAWLHRELTRGS